MASMTSFAHHLRARTAPLAALALVLVLAGAALAAQAHRAPVAERVTSHEVLWTEDAAFTYSVPVTRNESVWPIGTELPMGEPAYYRTVSPRLPLQFTWMPSAPRPLEGPVYGELVLRVSAEARDGSILWQFERVLDRGFQAQPGGIRLAGEVDLDALVTEVHFLTQELPPADARLNHTVEAVITYALAKEDGDISGKARYHLPIAIADPRFVLPDADELRWEQPHLATRTAVVAHPAGWAGVMGSLPALGGMLAGLVLLVALAWAREADPTRGMDLRETAFHLEHAAHAEWVTPSRRPLDPARLAPLVVEVDSLEALVHAAADARARIILDMPRRVYYLPLPQVTYRYARHAARPVASPARQASPTPRP